MIFKHSKAYIESTRFPFYSKLIMWDFLKPTNFFDGAKILSYCIIKQHY
jgi:hypothetical protein